MAITKVELEGSYLLEEAEKLGFKSMQDYYTSLLSTGQQSAMRSSQKYYQTSAQTAAEKASYDISGAYVNYLKQQRNIASQGRLESGYKEEIGDVLQQQYQKAYSQAKTTQANALTAAASEASDLYTKAYEQTSNMVSQVAKQYQQQATTKANLFKAAEEFAELKGDKSFDWYTTNPETGETEITPWGVEQYRSTLLQYGDEFKTHLEDEKLEDELKYYLSDPIAAHKEMFGFKETDYGVSEESKKASAEARLVTKGYVHTIKKPTVGLKDSDFSGFSGTKKTDAKMSDARNKLIAYADSLGLSPDEYNTVLNNYDRMSRKVNTKEGSKEGLDPEKVEEYYKQYINELIALSEHKYGITE